MKPATDSVCSSLDIITYGSISLPRKLLQCDEGKLCQFLIQLLVRVVEMFFRWPAVNKPYSMYSAQCKQVCVCGGWQTVKRRLTVR